jgi:membrane protease YdiL (CAAX protease family)
MPIRQVPQIYWYALVGIPLLIAVALTTRLLGFTGEEIGLRLRAWRCQVAIALSGVPLSLVAFWIMRPTPLFAEPRWYDWVLGAVILLVFTGFAEEVLYRGLLQAAAGDMPGLLAVLYSSVVFTIMYIGTLSLGYVLFVQVMSLFFGWCVLRTRSIWGVVLAHGITNIGLLLLWPYVWS